MGRKIEVFGTTDELVVAVAERILKVLNASIEARGTATLVLSGGVTPQSVYKLLASEQYRHRIDWARVHIFWGDERCVPSTSKDNNFEMTRDTLLKRIVIPEQNVHRIQSELPPQDAAALFEQDIRQVFNLKERGWPVFDLVLLGLGPDGHTASLFPGTTAVEERSRIATEVYVKKIVAFRITLTLPVINHARTVVFLVSGRRKAGILGRTLERRQSRYPAQLVKPRSGRLIWMVDKAAAANLVRIPKS
jgi:6-phosphogluconolactonase